VLQRHRNISLLLSMIAHVSKALTKSLIKLCSSIAISISMLFLLSQSAMAAAPVVSVTSPANNAKFASPSNITIAANATNTAGATITKVDFYRGTTLIGTDTTAPYSVTWSNATNGSYSITAKATNSASQTTTSAAVVVVVNNPPTLSLTAPANNTSVAGKATVSLTATASDTGGSISKVEFFNGSTLLGSDTTSPYSFSWNNVVPGTYSITAKATDNLGGTLTTGAVALVVTNPLSTSLTAPANNSVFAPGTAIALTANASTVKTGTTISKVEFYRGSTLLNSDTSAPYSFSWTGAAVGSYSITAKVTDSQGLTQTSSPIAVQVKAANVAPTISVTAPATNTSYAAPATINFSVNAAATGAGNSITKVEYFNGSTLMGTATAAPFSFSWTNVATGSYSVTAKATDANGLTQTSTPISLSVNGLPTVALLTPVNNASLIAPASINLTASAAAVGAGNTISKVEYFQGSTLIGSATAAPYTFNWANVPTGTYSITAKATDTKALTQTSSVVTVKVNTLPTVSLTAPLADANFIAPATINLTSDPVATGAGNSISKVEYFEGSNLVATANAAPFSASWNNVIAGSYSLTAKATDSNNNSITSSPVAITVINNTAPTVSFTANPSNATAPATIVINATAADTDGTIVKVELFNGETNIATMEAPPFNFLWENVAAGSYVLKAKATDNLGATKTSSDIPVNVTAAVPVLYDIHVDHLGTPRMVTDSAGNSVWEWIGTPFGESLPNQNPSGVAGKEFVMNLRFPGQVFDQETGLHYNYFRDYDPNAGRYVQSDPIGLGGGINTYDYVNGRPFEEHDRFGLAPGLNMSGSGSGYGNGGTPAGARAFENFFKKNISPVHDRRGNPITVNGSIGVGGQIHGGMKGLLGEVGIAADTLGNFKIYRKICVVVGPGFYAGAGGSAGAGVGDISENTSETWGAIVSATFVPSGSISIEGNEQGVGASWSMRPSIKQGIGAMCGVMKCYYVYY